MPAAEDEANLASNPREGEHVFGVAHIFASFNDTFVVRNPSMSFNSSGRKFEANLKYLSPCWLNQSQPDFVLTTQHVTDLSGKETIVRVSGKNFYCGEISGPYLTFPYFIAGDKPVKADRDEASPYAAMLAAQDVAVRCKVRRLISVGFRLTETTLQPL